MNNILENIIAGSDFTVEVFESDLDHYHFLIRYIPRLSISQYVGLNNNPLTSSGKSIPFLCQNSFGASVLSGQMVTSIVLLVKHHLKQYVNTSAPKDSVSLTSHPR